MWPLNSNTARFMNRLILKFVTPLVIFLIAGAGLAK
jgi:hypothetical protein